MYSVVKYYMEKDFSNRLEIQDLRVQRHDFSKHLNVLKGMAATDEYLEMKQYLDCLGEKVVFAGKLLQIGCPPVSVLIEEKETNAREKDIEFELEVSTNLKKFKIDPTYLCTLLGNLIDNAIDAAEKCESETKYILIVIGHHENFFFFEVSNTGEPISERDLKKIFTPGYSTKQLKKGHGIGLYIVKKILRKNHGRIEIRSENGLTAFTVFLPDC